MSDVPRKAGIAKNEQGTSVTQEIRRLTISESNVPGPEQHLEERYTALLICRDSDAIKWARRWLAREQIDVEVADGPGDCLERARAVKPDVIIVEGVRRMSGGDPIVRALTDAEDIDAPLIVLSSTSKDLAMALEANVFDVVRKPYEWRILASRAKTAARLAGMQNQVKTARAALAEALEIANTARRQLHSSESFEPITGLPNKKKFVDLLKRGMRAVDRDENVMAVFVVGFNRFRLVIEAMGQESADMVLTEIGKKLGACLKDVGLIQAETKGLRTSAAASIDQARFALMLTCSGDQEQLAVLQLQIVEQLSRPVHISGQTVYLSASLGVALYPQDGSDADSLLQRADNAMRDAQSRGGGFKFYCTETDAAAARKLKLEHLLHEAMNESRLALSYQPIVSATTGELSGAEALLRWKQEDGTYISPSEFIPVAEESGLMIRVGQFVLDQACQQMRKWLNDGIKVPYICVNVARAQLMQSGFARTVRRVLDAHAIEPAQLELELSERGVLSGDFDVISQLHEIKELGVRLSIDDFGTGDSAIAYLKELPIDVLKIDRSYIDGLIENRKDAAIISGMIALGHSLDLKIVAEGVESQEQLEALRKLGCDEIQGFYLAEPLSERLFAAFLQRVR